MKLERFYVRGKEEKKYFEIKNISWIFIVKHLFDLEFSDLASNLQEKKKGKRYIIDVIRTTKNNHRTVISGNYQELKKVKKAVNLFLKYDFYFSIFEPVFKSEIFQFKLKVIPLEVLKINHWRIQRLLSLVKNQSAEEFLKILELSIETEKTFEEIATELVT